VADESRLEYGQHPLLDLTLKSSVVLLQGKRVLVTGGTSGIGAETVRVLARAGASVGVHCHTSFSQAEALVDGLPKRKEKHRAYRADLAEPESANDLTTAFLRDFDGIDVLVNNAGSVFGNVDFVELSPADWDRTFALNARGPFLLMQGAFEAMRRQGGGKIINISSVSAKYGGSAFTIHYGASKAALESLTVGIARAGAEHNILVNAIRCGFIDTSFHRKMGRTEADVEARIRLIPLRRAGLPADVAATVLHLAGPSGDFVTGEILTVAGGD
jgi:3-oxoacyl-[acyl-carrier protein] reductase